MASRQLETVLQHIRRLASPPSCQLSDRQLLDRFVSQQDESAFAALVQRHGPMVLGVCRRVLRHDQDAEDACQAAFLVLARKAGSIRKRDCAGSWLHGVAYRIARNLSREVARRRARERPVADISLADPAGDLSWREVQAALDEELHRLPERYRSPLVLCYLEGKTRDEAAQHLGWTVGTLRGRLERGREIMRSRLVRRGLTLGAALLGSTFAPQATAAIPPNLMMAAVQGAKWALTGQVLPSSVVSAQVAALTKGGLKTMALTKIKIAAALLVALSALGGGAGALTLGTSADEPAQAQKEDSAAPPKTEKAANPEASRERQQPEKAATAKPASGTITENAAVNASAAVLSVTFSPDGKVLASGGSDGKVILWDVGTGKIVRTFDASATEKVGIHTVTFSPAGKALAAGGADHYVRLWDITTGKELANFRGHENKIVTVTYSPDGKQLASVGADHVAITWDLATAKLKWKFQRVGSLAFAPDGRIVAAAIEDGTVSLLDARTGKLLRQFGARVAYSPSAGSLAFSPDGKLVAAFGQDAAVRLLDVASGKEILRLTHDKWVMSIAFSPDGRLLASAGEDRTIRLWDLATGRKVAVLKGHKDTVNSVAFSPDGSLLATGSSDKSVKLWDLKAGRGAQRAPDSRGDFANDPLEQLLDDLVKKQKNDQESIEALYLATLARYPTETETKVSQEFLSNKEDRRGALKELLFALINTKEFTAHLESLEKRHSPRQH